MPFALSLDGEVQRRSGVDLRLCGSRESRRLDAKRGPVVMYEEVRSGRAVCEGGVGHE